MLELVLLDYGDGDLGLSIHWIAVIWEEEEEDEYPGTGKGD